MKTFFMITLLSIVGMESVSADVLLLESIQAKSDQQAASWPAKGRSKNAVEAAYGAPVKKVSAVGTPPISRWIYKDFTVYFESEHVIHSVANRE